MKKEIYEAPEMEITEFEMADVITTSGRQDCGFVWSEMYVDPGITGGVCNGTALYTDTGECAVMGAFEGANELCTGASAFMYGGR